jgi:hypothetical protein
VRSSGASGHSAGDAVTVELESPASKSERLQLVAGWAAAVCAIWVAATIIGMSAHAPRGDVPFPRSAIQVLASWDGQHYQDIAENGYSIAPRKVGFFAFFPALPVIARLLGGRGHAALAGILVSQLAFLACLMLLTSYAPRERPGLFRQPGFWILLSPVGFFFLAFYTESLFLLSVLLLAAAVRREKLALGSAAGLIAGLTRPTAIVLPLLAAGSMARNRRLGFLALMAVAPLVGVAIYFAYVGYRLGDPLGYVHVQRQAFGRWGSAQLALPFSGDLGELRSLLNYAVARKMPPLDIPVSLFSTAVVIAALVAWRRRIERPLMLYSVGALLFIHSATSPSSSARYELMLFPAFVGIAGVLAQRPRLALAAALLSAGLEMALFHKFATWEFVA